MSYLQNKLKVEKLKGELKKAEEDYHYRSKYLMRDARFALDYLLITVELRDKEIRRLSAPHK